jgi:hypothetical protein
LAGAFFAGAFCSINSFTSSNVSFEASTSLLSSIFIFPLVITDFPQRAFSTLMPSSFQ